MRKKKDINFFKKFLHFYKYGFRGVEALLLVPAVVLFELDTIPAVIWFVVAMFFIIVAEIILKKFEKRLEVLEKRKKDLMKKS